MTATIAFRRALPRDEAFIIKGWLESFRTSHAAGVIPMAQYYDVYRAALTDPVHGILARPGVEVWVAYNPSEADPQHELYGFLCWERDAREPAKEWDQARGQSVSVMALVPQVIHYAYVKDHHKRTGLKVATRLAQAAGINLKAPFCYSFKTPVGTEAARRYPHARFNPLIARFPKTK